MSVRLNGQFLLTGAIGAILSLLFIFLIPGPQGITGPGSIPANMVAVLSGLLLLAGLPALYRAQAKQIGILGFVGVVLLWVGMVLFLLVLSGVQILDVAMPDSIPHPGGDGPPPLALIPAILGGVLIVIGSAVVGITTIRAHVLAAAIGWIIISSSLLLLLMGPVGGGPIPRWAWMLVFLWLVQIIPWALPPDSPYQILNWPPLLFAGAQLVLWGTSMGVQLYRYTLVSDQVQRQQCKWLIFGFALALLIDSPYFGLQGLFPALAAASSPYRLLYATVRELFLVFIPLAIGIAILRYRLWDIDLIINRTLVYGALTLSVIGLYVLVIVGLGTLIQVQGNALLSLLATGVIAVLFQPLRLRLQRGVNRLMYGERDDPYAVLTRLGSRLEATLVPEKVLPTIVETVAQALKLPYVAIALLPEEQSFTATAAGTAGGIVGAGAEVPDIVASSGMPMPEPVRVPLVYQAETIGYLLLAARTGDTFGKADSRLLVDLARQAGVAVHAVRLTAHLQHLTESLQQARERLVTTREEERRRLRRDLHDGLGPALASLTFKVDAARNLLTQDHERTETLLAEVRQQAQEAITDIRRLVYNLRPPALDEFGLLSALREQVALYQHQGLELDVDVPSSLPPLPAAVEVAAYRIAQEALTNVAHHAEARHGLLHLSIDAETLHLEITDDGRGIPAGHQIGVGLHAMHERASELGGSCTITRGSSGGTAVRVTLPLGTTRDSAIPSAQDAAQQDHASASADDASVAKFET
jgi:signal transduction histidine kinase